MNSNSKDILQVIENGFVVWFSLFAEHLSIFMKNPILYVHNRMNKTDSIQMAHSYILSDVVICQWQVVQLFASKVNSPYSDLLNIDKI